MQPSSTFFNSLTISQQATLPVVAGHSRLANHNTKLVEIIYLEKKQ
jgi:hypothetical protein